MIDSSEVKVGNNGQFNTQKQSRRAIPSFELDPDQLIQPSDFNFNSRNQAATFKEKKDSIMSNQGDNLAATTN